jgi:hypothetical protein
MQLVSAMAGSEFLRPARRHVKSTKKTLPMSRICPSLPTRAVLRAGDYAELEILETLDEVCRTPTQCFIALIGRVPQAIWSSTAK